MGRLTWNGGEARRDSAAGRSPRGRGSVRAKPACEALDGRQLLSTAAAPAVLPAPPAAAVANAATELNAIDPTDFAEFQKLLGLAESHSHVTRAEVGKLAQDEAAIDRAIDAAGLDANTTATDLHQARDRIDHAFLDTTYQAKAWAGQRQTLHQDLAGVPGATPLVDRTIARMQVVARAATPTGSMPGVESDGARIRKVILPASLATGLLERGLPEVWRNLENAVTSTSQSNPSAVAADPHPLEVYYAGQVNNFLKG
jgi:hypothetical protein